MNREDNEYEWKIMNMKIIDCNMSRKDNENE
jgi:hypothetical protein